MKRTLLIALLLFMIVCHAVAEETEYTSGDYTYILQNDGTAMITCYTGSDVHLVLPKKLDGHSVTTTFKEVFAFCENLETVTIPNSYTSVGLGAFDGCPNFREFYVADDHPTYSVLNGVLYDKAGRTLIAFPNSFPSETYIIPDGTEIIGQGAFSMTSNLYAIQIPDSVTRIESYAFSGCENLREIELPDSINYIGEGAFGSTRLHYIEIPEGVEELKEYTFTHCYSLNYIKLPDSLRLIQGNPFFCDNNLYEIHISEDHPVFEMNGSALIDKNENRLVCLLQNYDSEEYVLPEGLEIIGQDSIMRHDNLEKVVIPDSVTIIESGAFIYCENLKDVNLPTSLITIEDQAFMHCKNLNSIEIPKGTVYIGEMAFSCCENLQKISIPNSVTQLDPNAFIWSDSANIIRE